MRGKRRRLGFRHRLLRIIPAHAGQTLSVLKASISTPDHPRTCGANPMTIEPMSTQSGSSPHMRGKRTQWTRRSVRRRIIPAHAGQTRNRHGRNSTKTDHPRTCGANGSGRACNAPFAGSSPHMRGKRPRAASHAPTQRPRTDHPRTCGANGKPATATREGYGSSPHMRGKPAVLRSERGAQRIIPAHAGQTPWGMARRSGTSDHPRTCGANSGAGLWFSQDSGSSPHMRGKLTVLSPSLARQRIIPAHAGQTPAAIGRSGCQPDHPRTCGANPYITNGVVRWHGSSPHMRGKQTPPAIHAKRPRIIPAHAGQTRQNTHHEPGCADHPRTCGANLDGGVETAWLGGSSPHMRGKRGLLTEGDIVDGIIPAHAGQTFYRPPAHHGRPDHPRTCGANSSRSNTSTFKNGSSPHMRGKPARLAPPVARSRIIPAHAGQTPMLLPRPMKNPDHPRTCGANWIMVLPKSM
ncbi:hypothetical protein PG1604B_1278 [Bifidobacterium pseudolongum subsp. pseudolongum]|nr:hypothetical protein PG1604B_1278 [Bifidobacterium pseudolongum subsp. pseudolongum]